mmetsp:Transcript_27910/g.64856  ORF Transcript_27910/g.64856 Transcript_27910/m.64856 type:complete len:202 (+) Transcript_27910:224-829(+)
MFWGRKTHHFLKPLYQHRRLHHQVHTVTHCTLQLPRQIGAPSLASTAAMCTSSDRSSPVTASPEVLCHSHRQHRACHPPLQLRKKLVGSAMEATSTIYQQPDRISRPHSKPHLLHLDHRSHRAACQLPLLQPPTWDSALEALCTIARPQDRKSPLNRGPSNHCCHLWHITCYQHSPLQRQLGRPACSAFPPIRDGLDQNDP